MEIMDVNYKRFVANEGMALKWTNIEWDYICQKPYNRVCMSPYDAIVDVNNIVGKVEEIPMKVFMEEHEYLYTSIFGCAGE